MSFEAMSRKERREFIREDKISAPKMRKNKKRKKPHWIEIKMRGAEDERNN